MPAPEAVHLPSRLARRSARHARRRPNGERQRRHDRRRSHRGCPAGAASTWPKPSTFDRLAGLERTELANLAARATTNQPAAHPLRIGVLRSLTRRRHWAALALRDRESRLGDPPARRRSSRTRSSGSAGVAASGGRRRRECGNADRISRADIRRCLLLLLPPSPSTTVATKRNRRLTNGGRNSESKPAAWCIRPTVTPLAGTHPERAAPLSG